MVAGIDVDLFRPDEELKKLAQLADRPRRRRPDRRRCGGHAGRDGRRRGRQAVVGGLGRGAPPLVQLLVGLGLLPLRQGLGGVPRHPDGLHRVVRREARPRRVARPPDRGDRDRARPDRRGVLRADRRRREPRDLRGQARPGPRGLPVRREPQLLRRALGHVPGLGQDAPARPAAHRRRLLRQGRRHLPAAPQRGAGRDLRLLPRLGGRRTGPRPAVLGTRDPAPPGHHAARCARGRRRRRSAYRRR